MAGVTDPIIIPYRPRPLQQAIHDALQAHRWGVVVCHRRFGKSVLLVNHLQRAALTCPLPDPRFAYIAPTYSQGKLIIWDYMKRYAAPIPHVKINESEMRVDYPNGARLRIFGADNPDSLRGAYFDGAGFDEYGLQRPNIFAEVVRPMLTDRGGWAAFFGTPNGKNQFYDAVQYAKTHADWYFVEHKASETGIIPPDELASNRAMLTPDQYAQEYECSFEASVLGAVYARELRDIVEQGRITRVPYDPAIAVDTDWDFGVADATAIWFSQTIRQTGEVRLIDYYEAAGHGLDHYKKVLGEKPYAYGTHWGPHDLAQRELTSGNSRIMTARQMGLNFMLAPRVEDLKDGIHACQMLLPKCWFDAERTQLGVEALKNYRWDYNTKAQSLTSRPVHNWASHGADAFRTLAYRWYLTRKRPEAEAAAELRRAQRDTDPFRWETPSGRGRAGYP